MHRQKNKDVADDTFISPDRKRSKVTYPRISYSDKGKAKETVVSIVHGSSSEGVKKSAHRDIYPTILSTSSCNVVDLTIPPSIRSTGPDMKACITKVYSRRRTNGRALNTRTTPAAFHDALKKLNSAQKAAVRDIGFGTILELKVKDLPGRLGYWILNKFNADTCELEIDARRRVAVTQADVYRVFGFPGGQHSIDIFERQSNSELFEQWFSFFSVNNRDKIMIGLVLNKMLDCKCGGTWFKRHFMIAMAFSLFESRTNGTVHPFILRCLSDLRSLGKWNWAEYMIASLIRHTPTWGGDPNKVYAGPALFLTLFYVDRVCMPGPIPKRDFPILVNWSSDDLRQRQHIELDTDNAGAGTILGPIQLQAVHTADVVVDEMSEEEKTLNAMVKKEAKDIAERMKNLSIIVENAPVAVKASPFFQKAVNDACKLTGMTIDIVIPKSKPTSPIIEIEDDLIEYPKEFLDLVDRISAEACSKRPRDRLKDIDIPSFDLNILDDDDLDVIQGHQSPVMGLVSSERGTNTNGHGTTNKFLSSSMGIEAAAKDDSATGSRIPLRSIDNNALCSGFQTPPQVKKHVKFGTSNLQSQHVRRGVCTRLQLSRLEKQIGMYALHMDAGEECKILFSYKDIALRRYEIMTLKRGHPVDPSVVNAWCIILNSGEVCCPEGETRFFASTEIYVDCIAPTGQSYEEKRQSFFVSMLLELKIYQSNPVSRIDLFFFPVYEECQFYGICVDTIRQRFFVLDSIVDFNGTDYCNKYNQICSTLRSMFTEYLNYVNEEQKAKIVAISPIEVVRMKWADVGNEIDSGVYLMRHLETFVGDSSPNWDCNISKSSPRQICRMRVRYCASILMWKDNKDQKEVAEESSEYYAKLCANGASDIDFKLMG